MMNLRILLSVFVLASVIGLMAVTTIAAMSMQKAYSTESETYVKTEWCFKENGQDRCFSSLAKCHQEQMAAAPKSEENPAICVKYEG